ncbi:amidase [Pusillimonas sp.]|uniref:amidase n=1 Tax=Pusillimonas sp. TaxID=3040095 RepID=UPI0037C80A8E
MLALDCAGLARAFREGECTPVHVLEALRAAVEAGEPINAFCHLDWPAALRAADESGQRHRSGASLGPLDGVPISIKDLTDVAGWPTRFGSLSMAEAKPAKADAPVVERLRRAGAVLFGKTTTTEFGWTIRSDNPLTGLTRNPLDPSRSAGGSSSGAAAQVAAGWGPLALGSDAGGSVRVPASFCGLVGFKPSFGAIPMPPSSAFTELAHLGVLTRSVADCRAAMRVLDGPDPRDPASTFPRLAADAPARRPRLGWTLFLGSELPPEDHVVAAFHSSLEQLRAAGYSLQEVDPRSRDCADAMWDTWRYRSLEAFHGWPEAQRNKLSLALQQLYREGEAMSTAKLAQARTRLRKMAVDLGQVFNDIDILLTPTMPHSAPLALDPAVAGRASADNWLRHSGYAYPFNVTGQPALSLPMGLCPQGMPLGLQIAGRKYHDHAVLRLGAELETLLTPPPPTLR